MRAGRLHHYADVYRRSGKTPSWQWYIIGSIWCSFEPDMAMQSEQQGILSQVDVPTRARYSDILRPGLVLAWNSRYFLVHAVATRAERGAEMMLSCREFVGNPATLTHADALGSPKNCIAFLRHNVTTQSIGDGWQQSTEPRSVLELPAFQFAQLPAKGDTIVIDGQTWTIDAPPEHDDGIVYRYIVI